MSIDIVLRKKGVWSQKFDNCIICKKNVHKHASNGICKKCYNNVYRKNLRKRLLGKIDANNLK